jgi:DNA-binding NarL/FixJ family response regulator
MTRIVICDDQSMIRAGLRSLLESEPDIEVVGEAGDGDEAIALVKREAPDVALMDIRMPNLDGLEATRRLMRNGSGTRIVVLTTFDLDEYVFQALRAGASGFVLKDSPAEVLVHAVRAAASGDALLAAPVTKRVIDAFVDLDEPRAEARRALEQLTARELEVLELIAAGRTNPEIADTLVVSPATVKSHIRSLLMKTGLRDRVQLVIVAYEAGVVSGRGGP